MKDKLQAHMTSVENPILSSRPEHIIINTAITATTCTNTTINTNFNTNTTINWTQVKTQ